MTDTKEPAQILCYACEQGGGTLRKLEVYVHADGPCSALTSQGLQQLQQAIRVQLNKNTAGNSGVRSAALGGVPADKVPPIGAKG